ncbi:hypothetical protein Cni_G15318 [Canna indica]|uniref:Uncharacterized protein n=1 Tax=Canna indica TaxID=4628 RepID=A0AAQ3QD58_9LILI|nr:hypothetical protein Cni_G15318 [Canna indica]
MEQGEPALVPQWYKLGNGSTSNNALRTSTYERLGLGSKSRLLGDQDRNLRRSLSSNGSLTRDKGNSGKSEAYSSFRRSHDKHKEKDFDSRDREGRSVLLDNRFDRRDALFGVRAEKDALRRSQSMVPGRQPDSWPKRFGSNLNNNALPGGSAIGSISKTSFEREFPSLRAERKQDSLDATGVPPVGLKKTAAQSLPIDSPIAIGTSALAEVPVESNGSMPSPIVQVTPVCQASIAGSTMAEALAQAPSSAGNAPQLSVDTQKIEELALKKCKQLIPVTPSVPKTLSCNSMEKTKAKIAKGGDFSYSTNVGQQHRNLAVRAPARSDAAKTSQMGNFQVLNREKNGISPTAKDHSIISKAVDPIGHVPSAAVLPSKSQADNKNGSLTSISLAERKLLSQARNRNDFFNLLRKKSLSSSSVIPEPSSVEPTSSIEKETSLQNTSPANMEKNNLLSAPGLDCSPENGNVSNEDFCGSNESHGLYTDNGETNSYSDIVLDPEEEAFLQSLGWDKNAGEEALTEEEIDAFLKKYETRRPLKIMSTDLCGSNLSSADE